jgi:hypothetical protein
MVHVYSWADRQEVLLFSAGDGGAVFCDAGIDVVGGRALLNDGHCALELTDRGNGKGIDVHGTINAKDIADQFVRRQQDALHGSYRNHAGAVLTVEASGDDTFTFSWNVDGKDWASHVVAGVADRIGNTIFGRDEVFTYAASAEDCSIALELHRRQGKFWFAIDTDDPAKCPANASSQSDPSHPYAGQYYDE